MIRTPSSAAEPQEVEDLPPSVRVRTFGRFSLAIDGVELESSGAARRRPMELLKATIALGVRDVEVARLLGLLWPGAQLPAARQSFDTALHRLRKLAPEIEWLVLREGRLSLEIAHVWVDTVAFARCAERVVHAAGADDKPAVKGEVTELLRLYEGDFLSGDADRPWALQARDRERARFMDAIGRAGAHFEAAQAWLDAEDLYKRGLAVENLSEAFYRGLIRCLLARGEPAEALNAFRRCRELLSIVLNLQPGAETLALVREIYDSAERDLPLPGKPSIAVLPFANLSAVADQEYFADGVVEDVITALSCFHSLFVIARNSSFIYKGQAVDVRVVARELGVRYVLEGSIRRAAERVRVTAQLIDATTGNHIWAEHYDRTVGDIFAVQEELTQSIVMAIAPQIDAAEREKAHRRRPERLSAYEIAVRARAHSLEAYIKSDRALREQAIGEARQALAIEPGSTIALNALARLQWQQLMFGNAADRNAAWLEGMNAATKAIEVDRLDGHGYANLGLLLSDAKARDRMDEALGHLRHALELNPNNVNTLNALGFVEVAAGNPDRGIEHLQQALRLSPRDPIRYSLYLVLAIAGCSSGRFAYGVECARLGLRDAPGMVILHVYLAANLVGLDQIVEARAALDAARNLGPEFVRRALEGDFIYRKPDDLKRVTTFLLVAAGMENPEAADALR